MYDKIKKWYDDGMWTKEMVYNAYLKGKITEAEYKKIVGEK